MIKMKHNLWDHSLDILYGFNTDLRLETQDGCMISYHDLVNETVEECEFEISNDHID